MKSVFLKISFGLVLLAVFSSLVFAQDELIFKSDFEKGKQTWEKRGAAIGITKKQAANGKKSLRVTGRREVWQGAQINVSKYLVAGKKYKFSVSVKLAKKESPDAIRMTMERGNSRFSGIAGVTANAEQWTTLTGTFVPTGSDPYLLVFIEAGRSTTAYFLDDFKIEGAPLVPTQKGVLVKNDFENFTSQGWYAFGNGVQMFSSKPLGSSRGIRVAGRTDSSHGVAVDLSPKFFKGRTYTLSISVRITKGGKADSLRMRIQQTAPDGEKTYVEVAPYKEVIDSEWTKLSGEYTVTTEGNNLLAIVEAKGASTPFLIDDFELRVKTDQR